MRFADRFFVARFLYLRFPPVKDGDWDMDWGMDADAGAGGSVLLITVDGAVEVGIPSSFFSLEKGLNLSKKAKMPSPPRCVLRPLR
jgi:hypothetical protein